MTSWTCNLREGPGHGFRAAIAVGKHSEVSGFYTPGFAPCTFEVDGFRFGALLCVEIQFGELWVEQRDLGVDCVLFSTYSDDPIFDVIARGYAAANSYWVSVAVPAACSAVMASAVIGPHGRHLAHARTGEPRPAVSRPRPHRP